MDGIGNLEELLQQRNTEFDFLCLCETWHVGDVFVHASLSGKYSVLQSSAIRERSRGRASGGLVLYYSNKYTARVLDTSPWWIISLFSYKCFNLILCVVYFKPTLQLDPVFEILQDLLSEARANHSGIPIVICGDFNCRLGSLGESPPELVMYTSMNRLRASNDIVCNARGTSLHEFMTFNGFILINGRAPSDSPARFTFCSSAGRSVIDHFWCSTDSLGLVSDLVVLDKILCSSGHFPVQLLLITSVIDSDTHRVRSARTGRHLQWVEGKAESYSVAMSLSAKVSCSFDDIQRSFSNFKEAVWNVSDGLGLVKSYRANNQLLRHKPWFDSELYNLKKSVKESLRLCRAVDFSEPFLSTFLGQKQQYRKALKRKKIEFEKSVVVRLSNTRNQKEFWRTLQAYRAKPVTSSISLEQWESFYSSVSGHRLYTELLFYDARSPILDEPITYDEITSALNKVRHGKSPGMDGISYEFLKHLPQNWLLYLTCLFNKIFDSGSMPVDWHTIILTMLHKKGPTNLPENYRGIALVSCVLKLYTLIFVERLKHWAAVGQVLPESQAGFREGRGCIDNVFSLSAVIQLHLRLRGRMVYAAFIDFSRAFDMIQHWLLWQKLYALGVGSKVIQTLKHLYDNASFQVRVDGELSRKFDVSSGVLQGESLSPLLFSLFLADIETYFRNRGARGLNIDNRSDLLLLSYADDLVIVSDSPVDLQRKLNILEDYVSEIKLAVNVDKTKVVRFSRSPRIPSGTRFYYNGNNVEIVKGYSYLGVYFSSSSLFHEMTRRTVDRAALATSSILSLMSRSKIISWKARMKLYESTVLSSTYHCLPVWALRYEFLLERVQVRFFKNLLYLPRTTSDCAVRMETGVVPLSYFIFKHTLGWMEKLLRMESHRIPKICFNRLLELQGVDQRYNWFLQVKEYFGHIQSLSLLENLDADSLKRAKPHLLTRYQNFLYHRDTVERSRSAYLVFRDSRFGSTPEAVKYLTWCLPMYMTRIVTQLRLSTNRGMKLTYCGNSHFIDFTVSCSICNLHRDETLHHIFHECPVYRPIRTSFITRLGRDGFVGNFDALTAKELKDVSLFFIGVLKIRSFIINE